MKNLFKKEYLFPNLIDTVQRFPITVLFCLSSSILWIYLIDSNSFKDNSNLFYSFFLGMFLFIPITQVFESFGLKKKLYIGHLIGFGIIIAYYFSIDTGNWVKEASRFLLYIFSASVLIPVSFLLKKPNDEKLWLHFVLSIKNLISSIFLSAVMYAGVIIGMATIDYLFDFKIDEKQYLYIWFIFAGFYAPVLFLSNFHNEKTEFEGLKSYEVESFLIKFVITPLSISYLTILYFYFAKISIGMNLPKGILAYLIMSFCSLATFTHFVTHVYSNINTFKFINKYLYVFIVPLIFLLGFSIYIRISDYGITENRYIVGSIGVWLIFISIYMFLKRFNQYQMIFYSLCVVPLVVSIGPWGAFAVSEKSQINRLMTELKNANILHDGKIEKRPGSVKELKEISEIVKYLDNRNLIGKLEKFPFFEKPISKKSIWFQVGLDEVNKSEFSSWFNCNYDKHVLTEIKEYDYFASLKKGSYRGQQEKQTSKIDDKYSIKYDGKSVVIEDEGKEIVNIDLIEKIRELIETQKDKRNIKLTEENAYVNFDNGKYLIRNIQGKKELSSKGSDIINLNHVEIDIFFNIE